MLWLFRGVTHTPRGWESLSLSLDIAMTLLALITIFTDTDICIKHLTCILAAVSCGNFGATLKLNRDA